MTIDPATPIREPASLDSRDLLKEFIGTPFDEFYAFRVPAGEGTAIMQRCRVYLSRRRMKFKRARTAIKHFRLCSVIEPIDSEWELVKAWRTQSTRDLVSESFDDLVR